MDRADGSGWRFSEAVEEAEHVALYVRDTLGLPVPQGRDVPPPLEGPLPDRRQLLPGPPDAAGAAWLCWWRALVQRRVHEQRAGQVPADRGRPRPDPAVTPPGGLRDVVTVLQAEACAWAEGPRRAAHPPFGTPAFSWAAARQVAESTVRTRPADGLALVLAVRGVWWAPASDRVVVCSRAAAEDPVQSRLILRHVLAGGPTPA